jgi:ABC-2 type transport system permease protein
MAAAFASAVGAAGFELVAAIGVAILGAALVFDVVPPGGLAAAAFSASLALAFLVKFLLSYLTVVIALRTLHVQGLVWTRTAVFNLLSGALMPIAVMPEALRAVVEALPFRDVIATPIELFLGQRAGLDAALALGRQAAWVLALTALARWAWQRNVGRLEIQGG